MKRLKPITMATSAWEDCVSLCKYTLKRVLIALTVPGKKYTISVKKQATVDRSSPASRVVTIERADVTGFDFTLFRKSPAVEIAGIVKTNQPTALSLMKVELYGDDKTSPVKTIQLGPQAYFEFAGLEARDYFVRVRSASESSAWILTPAGKHSQSDLKILRIIICYVIRLLSITHVPILIFRALQSNMLRPKLLRTTRASAWIWSWMPQLTS